MKETKSKTSDDWALRTALFLRYGKDEINPSKPPTSLLSWRLVAKILKVPYQIILRQKRNFFKENKPKPQITKRITRSAAKSISPYPASRVTMANITDEEIDFITSRDTIREWSP